MENPVLIGESLSDARVIMVIMHVLMEELPFQAVWVPVVTSYLVWH
jgi:hypothetical protein